MVFEEAPANRDDPTFVGYRCEAWMISSPGEFERIGCEVRPAGAFPSYPQKYAALGDEPGVGQVWMGRPYAVDEAGNRAYGDDWVWRDPRGVTRDRRAPMDKEDGP